MLKLKFTSFLFFLATIFFVAKPFVGFGLPQLFYKPVSAKSVCLKSFTKRKPEYLEEADANIAVIVACLNNPPLTEIMSILPLLMMLFLPVFFYRLVWHPSTNHLYKPRFIYLLTGKLVI